MGSTDEWARRQITRRHFGQRLDAANPRAGLSLIEVLLSFSMLMVVLFAFTRVLLSGSVASQTSHEATIAQEAARGMMEVLQAADFDQVFAH